VVPVSFWAPQKFFAGEGVPSQLPCPKHGYAAVDQQQISSDGWSEARQVTGVSYDQYLIGTCHRCALCKAEKDRLRAEAAAISDAQAKAVKLQEARDCTYCNRSYDPRVPHFMFQRFPWMAVQMLAVLCSNRTAITPELAELIKRSCVTGSNPSDIASMLLESKYLHFDKLQTMYIGFLKWNKLSRRHTNSKAAQSFTNNKQKTQLSIQQALAQQLVLQLLLLALQVIMQELQVRLLLLFPVGNL
jgi:hypothetical protein